MAARPRTKQGEALHLACWNVDEQCSRKLALEHFLKQHGVNICPKWDIPKPRTNLQVRSCLLVSAVGCQSCWPVTWMLNTWIGTLGWARDKENSYVIMLMKIPVSSLVWHPNHQSIQSLRYSRCLGYHNKQKTFLPQCIWLHVLRWVRITYR